MGAMSEMAAEISELKAEKDEAFGWYNHLLSLSSPLTRTPAQEHEIHEARMRALAASDALDNNLFWKRHHESR